MAVNIPGSSVLTSMLNVISQSLLIPVIILLLIFTFYVVIALGALIAEYTSRKPTPLNVIKGLIYDIDNSNNTEELKKCISESKISNSQKKVLNEIASTEKFTNESREALARKLVEDKENLMDKKLRRTDIITRIGPTLGLMGTLIPLGTGLAALKTGDINTLADSLIVAFDTTVVGIGSGALAYYISKVRSGWYDEYINNLDALSDAILDFMKHKI